jgi:kynureninase
MNAAQGMNSGSLEQRLAWARAQDAADPLRSLRARFALPRGADAQALIYLCGHSLGLAPVDARQVLDREIERWERLGVSGHEHGEPGWIAYAEALQQPLSQLAGAGSHEVIAMNSLSVNLHLLLASFYRPSAQRRAILIEAGAFSSDRHVVASQLACHGVDPAIDLIELAPRDGEDLLRLEDIEQCIAQQASRLALILWPGVQYRTGQLFDLARISAAAHRAGALAGFDLAHAIGNVPLSLHADDADFAVWCSYKYLNAGPGAVGGAYVHERHLARAQLPRLTGWWGHDPATRFQMPATFTPAPGIAAWAISNPPIFSTAPLLAALPLFAQAGMAALRAKSLRLTGYLESLALELAGTGLQIVTPTDPAQRGCQLSLRVAGGAVHARRAFDALLAHGIIGDWREPDIIRLTPVPLYNSYEDVLRGAWQLAHFVSAPP